MAIVAGIIIAVATVAIIATLSEPSGPTPPADDNNGNVTDDEPQQTIVESGENLNETK